jgi:ribosomal protein L37AE/L43A
MDENTNQRVKEVLRAGDLVLVLRVGPQESTLGSGGMCVAEVLLRKGYTDHGVVQEKGKMLYSQWFAETDRDRKDILPAAEVTRRAMKEFYSNCACVGSNRLYGTIETTYQGLTFVLVAYENESRPGRFEDRFMLFTPFGHCTLNTFIRTRKSAEVLEREAAEKAANEARAAEAEVEQEEAVEALQKRIEAGEETPETKGRCPECGHVTDTEDFEQKVYECSRCGGIYRESDIEGHRCPDCNVFMAKLGDYSCADCEAALEDGPEEIEVYEADGDLFTVEDGKVVPVGEG